MEIIANADAIHKQNSRINQEVTIEQTEFGQRLVVRKFVEVKSASGTDLGSIPFARLSYLVVPSASGYCRG